MKTNKVHISQIPQMEFRFDPPLHLSEGVKVRSALNKLPFENKTLASVTEKIFLGNIFSRIWVKDNTHGIPYLAASDTVLANLDTGQFLAKRQGTEMPYLMLKPNWILVTCSGTLGKTTYTNNNFNGRIATHDLIRIIPNQDKMPGGYIYAFLSGKYGYYQITQSQFGGVVKHVNATQAGQISIPELPKDFQDKVDGIIKESAHLREDSANMLKNAEKIFKQKSNLEDLKPEDYNYFGTHSFNRKITSYKKNISEIGSITFNAFNHSEKIENIKQRISNSVKLSEILLGNTTFSTGSFPRVEVKAPNGVMLINQTDAFDNIIKGKNISLRKVNLTNLVEYGEVIVAGVGTLGENESFCRTLFANEDFEGQLISGEFIRMKTNDKVPSGYLFTWLNSDYGFRFIRHIHTGTKLCRPIPKLFLEIPIPILKKEEMDEIDRLVKAAHTKRHKANKLELEAISLVECEIEKWNKE